MKAIEIFKKGDRVVMTQRAIRQRLDGVHWRRTGTITGFTRDGYGVYVRRDGTQSSGAYWHWAYWAHWPEGFNPKDARAGDYPKYAKPRLTSRPTGPLIHHD